MKTIKSRIQVDTKGVKEYLKTIEQARKELKAIEADLKQYNLVPKQLGAKLVKVVKSEIEGSERVFVLMKKIKPTPKRYPRMAGTPKREPLGMRS